MTDSRPLGKVFLVGGGPGDPGLLTLRGRECLQQADLVLYDGLVNPLLLRHSSATAIRTCRSEGPDGRRLDQDEINEQLIAAAKSGKTVVRLKGGDPYIFGRGSEEAAALAAEGIPFEVVPGITTATAAGVYAGLSLTHRKLSSAVAFVTGHEDPGKAESRIDYDNLASFTGTLVFYMGLHRLPQIAESLIEAGKPAATPACVISRATTPLQRTVTAPLVDLPKQVAEAQLRAPSLIIVGDCVRQRDRIAWFEQRPLFGRTIGITRPDGQADTAVAQALALGAQPVLLPTIQILPPGDWSEVDAAISRLDDFEWLVFTSTNGVRFFFERLLETGADIRRVSHLNFAAIGPSTAEALQAFHLRADVVPDEYRAEALAEALAPRVAGCRVLWAGANRGRDVLPDELQAAGAAVTKVAVYRNEDCTELESQIRELLDTGDIDWIGLSSPSIARNLAKLVGPDAASHFGNRIKLATISPVTTAAALEAGLAVSAEATVYTWAGIFNAILKAEG